MENRWHCLPFVRSISNHLPRGPWLEWRCWLPPFSFLRCRNFDGKWGNSVLHSDQLQEVFCQARQTDSRRKTATDDHRCYYLTDRVILVCLDIGSKHYVGSSGSVNCIAGDGMVSPFLTCISCTYALSLNSVYARCTV